MKTRSPHTTGDDQPCPCTPATQRTFLSVDHSSGRPILSAKAEELAPRNCGQLSAWTRATPNNVQATTKQVRYMNPSGAGVVARFAVSRDLDAHCDSAFAAGVS